MESSKISCIILLSGSVSIIGGLQVGDGDLTQNDLFRVFLVLLFGLWSFMTLGSASFNIVGGLKGVRNIVKTAF